MYERATSPAPFQAARNVLFITRQQLLAQTLGRVLAHDGDWSVTVLDRDHPRLLDQVVAAEPVIVVVEMDTDVVPSLNLISRIVERLTSPAVIALGELDGATTAEIVCRGAKGSMTYAGSLTDLKRAFEAAAEGRTAVGSAALTGLVGKRTTRSHAAAEPPPNRLSPREREVLRRIAAGESTQAIADELHITVQTVRKHTQNILGKLGAHSKLQAAAIAVREALV